MPKPPPPSSQAPLFEEYDQAVGEMSGELDGPLARTNAYRSSYEFGARLQFIGRLPEFAPFNAALLYMQNPALRYVASAPRWKNNFRRTVRPTARAYVVLVPFGPVQFVYDVADTDPLDPHYDQLPASLYDDPFYTTGRLNPNRWSKTISRCEDESIDLKEDATLGKDHAGQVSAVVGPHPSTKEARHYRILLNANHAVKTRYATFSHELGHLFCGHVGSDAGAWWPSRTALTIRQRELEAEAVSYLVCERAGLRSMSERYLAGYTGGQDYELPHLSIDAVVAATAYIEAMSRPRFKTKRKPPRKLNGRAQ